jgi:hypothetical protein
MMPEIRLEFRRIQDSSLYYDGATEYYTVDIKREGVVFCLAGKSYLLSDPSMTSGVLEDALSRIEKKQRLKNLYEVPRRHFDTWMKNLIDKTTDPILTLEQKNELHANLLTRYSYQEIENFCAGHRSYDDKKIVDISWSEYWFWFPFLDFHIVVQKQKEIIIFEGENAFEEARSLYAQKMTEAVNKRLDIEIAKVHG